MPPLPIIVSIDTAMNAFSILKKFCENAGAGVKISSDLYDIEKFIISQKWENNNQQNRPVFTQVKYTRLLIDCESAAIV